jgi:hypothetical protein
MFIGHFAVGLAAKKASPKISLGTLFLAALVAFLVVSYAANLFGPPPPSGAAVEWGSLAAWIFVPWAFWIDRHRRTP